MVVQIETNERLTFWGIPINKPPGPDGKQSGEDGQSALEQSHNDPSEATAWRSSLVYQLEPFPVEDELDQKNSRL
jgi:hypothetical protein